MILRSLDLVNIRSYKNIHIDFPENIILFEGDIGSGKSTILMAIEFALFGLGEQKAASLLRKKETKGKVVLTFVIGDQEYEVGRTLEKKPNKKDSQQIDCYLIIGDTKYKVGSKELKPMVLKVLGFNEPASPTAKSAIFRYAIFTPQEEMKVILNNSPKERMQTIQKALRMEDYKLAEGHATNLSKQLEFKKKQRDAVQARITEAKQKIEALEIAIQTVETALAEHSTSKGLFEEQKTAVLQEKDTINAEILRLTSVESDIKSKRALLDTLKKQRLQMEREIEQAKKSQIEKDQQIKTLKQNITKMKTINPPSSHSLAQIKQDYQRVTKMDQSLSNAKAQYTTQSTTLKSLEEEAGDYLEYTPEELLAELEKNKTQQKELEESQKVKEEERDTANGTITALKSKIQEVKESIANIEQLGNKCPTCSQEITPETKGALLQQNEEIIKDLTKKGKFQQTRATALQKEIAEVKSNLNTLRDTYTAIKTKQATIDRIGKIRTELTKLSGTIEDLSQALNITENYPDIGDQLPVAYLSQLLQDMTAYTEQLNHLETLTETLKQTELDKHTAEENQTRLQQDLEINQTSTSNTEDEIYSLENEIGPFDAVKTQFENLKRQQETIQQSILNEVQEITRLTAENKSNSEKLQESKDAVDANNLQLGNIDKAVDYYNWLTQFFIPTLPKIEQTLMFQINHDFNTNFKKWFEILVPDETKSVSVDEEFTPIITQDGVDQNVDFLSGGERTSIALAYRLALNAIIQENVVGVRSNLLIFDEPTDGFSKEQLFKFRDILSELNCPQIILVSHEKELEGFVDQIFKVQKQNGISSVTQLKN